MKRVAIYVRVSTQEQKQNGFSVDAQIDALKNYCKDKHYLIHKVYNDAGISASKSYKHRYALLEMLEDVKDGYIELVLFTKLDRWFRSVGDYYEVQKVLDEHKVPWRAIWEDYETETSAGVFKVNIMLSIAMAESQRTSERIKATNDYKRSLGQVCSGGVALGFVIKDKKWYIDKDMEQYIRRFYEVYLATFSIKLSVKACEEMGYHFTPKNANRLLRNPAYYGEPYYVVESYLTKEQHEIIEGSLKHASPKRIHTHLFSGIIYCGHCGGRMSPQGIRYDRSQLHPRYVCSSRSQDINSCIGATTREADLESYLLDKLDVLLSDYQAKVNFKTRALDTELRINQLKAKLNRLKDLYELGDIELNVYIEKRNTIISDISELENISPASVPKLPENWKDIYLSLDKEHKHSFWLKTIKRIDLYGRMLSQEPKIFF